jgi:hypothetical protein
VNKRRRLTDFGPIRHRSLTGPCDRKARRIGSHSCRICVDSSVGQEDRDWYREDRKRRDELVVGKKRRWRWPYRLRRGLPWWFAEPLQIAIFMTPIVLAYLWKHFQ